MVSWVQVISSRTNFQLYGPKKAGNDWHHHDCLLWISAADSLNVLSNTNMLEYDDGGGGSEYEMTKSNKDPKRTVSKDKANKNTHSNEIAAPPPASAANPLPHVSSGKRNKSLTSLSSSNGGKNSYNSAYAIKDEHKKSGTNKKHHNNNHTKLITSQQSSPELEDINEFLSSSSATILSARWLWSSSLLVVWLIRRSL